MAVAQSLQLLHRPEQAEVLFNPIRLRLLEKLDQPSSASEAAAKVGIPRQLANYHLRELERVGLVRLVEERRRGSATERILQAAAAYVVDPSAMGKLAADPRRMADRFSLEYLVALAERMVREVSGLIAKVGPRKHVPSLSMETEIRFRSAEERADFAQELANEVARLAAKYHEDKGGEPMAYRLLVAAHPLPETPSEEPNHV